MPLTIDLTQQVEAWLNAKAQQQRLRPEDLALRVIEERAATYVPPTQESRDATIALLQSWIAEDATDDPEEIRRAEEDLVEFKRNMNANRAATGERLVFPMKLPMSGRSLQAALSTTAPT